MTGTSMDGVDISLINTNGTDFVKIKCEKSYKFDKNYQDNLVFVKGKVEQTLEKEKNIPKKISSLRLDTDFYESTKKEMEVLYPRLQNKGVLIIDDYGHWKGSKKAVDDYFKNDLNFKFFHRIDYASRLYIKE